MAEKFNGTWKIVESVKFDEYMKAIGVGLVMRKAGNATKPVLTIKFDGKVFEYSSVSTFKTITGKHPIDEEFDETTPDGRKCKSVISFADNKLVRTQKWNKNNVTTISRSINSKGQLIMDLEYDKVKAYKVYEKQATIET